MHKSGKSPRTKDWSDLCRASIALSLMLLFVACDGTIGSAGMDPGTDPIDPETPRWLHEGDLPTTDDVESYARLTRMEYRFVLSDLLVGSPAPLRNAARVAVESFAQNTYSGYYNNYADINVGTQLAANQWAMASATAAAFIESDWYRELCPTEGVCVANVASEMLPRVWKRRCTIEEEADLIAFFGALPEEGRSARFFTRIFLSPYFNFKVFSESPATTDEVNIKRAQLLSFALSGSYPDDALQSDVDSGEIESPGRWQNHINRLLGEHGLRFSTLFVTQWLGLAPLYEVNDTYLEVPERAVMSEPARIFHQSMLDGASIASFLDLNFNVVNQQTAPLYGSTHGEAEWVREVLTDTLFGTAALSRLYVDVDTRNPSPIRRGSFVANRLLCRNLRFPDSSVQEEVDSVVDSVPEGLSPPERLAFFRSHDTCASCHEQFDPYGLALEDIGLQGEMRTNYYTGDLIIVDGEFEGQSYSSSAEFVDHLAQSETFHHCFASQLHSYITGASHLDVFRRISEISSLHNAPIGGLVSTITANALGVDQ